MAPKIPLAMITDAAQGAASLPLKATEKVADLAMGLVAGGARVAASLIYSTAERAKSMVGVEEEKDTPAPTDASLDANAKSSGSSTASRSSSSQHASSQHASSKPSSSGSFASPAPGPVTAPVAAPLESVEALAEAAVAREMAEEPLTTSTPSKPAGATAPAKVAKTKKVFSTSTGAASTPAPTSANGALPADEPLIDPATDKAVKSETDILGAAADMDKDL